MPMGIGRCDASPTPVSSTTICSSSAAWNRWSFSLPGSHPELAAQEPLELRASLESPRLAGQVPDVRRSRPIARSSSTNSGSAGSATRDSPWTGGQHASATDAG